MTFALFLSSLLTILNWTPCPGAGGSSSGAWSVVPELPPPSEVPTISLTQRAKHSANGPQPRVAVGKGSGKKASALKKKTARR